MPAEIAISTCVDDILEVLDIVARRMTDIITEACRGRRITCCDLVDEIIDLTLMCLYEVFGAFELRLGSIVMMSRSARRSATVTMTTMGRRTWSTWSWSWSTWSYWWESAGSPCG